MAVPIRTTGEIDAIARACAVAASAAERAVTLLKPGVTARLLDAAIDAVILEAGGRSAFRGVRSHKGAPFPGAACICVNDVLAHGVPDDRLLEAGDRLTLDVGVLLDGWYADSAWSAVVGVGERGRRVTAAAARATEAAIGSIVPGRRWSGCASAASDTLGDYRLVTGFLGHGVGRALHEPPRAPIEANPVGETADFHLRPGMVFTVEPIVAEPGAGLVAIQERADGWNARASDGAWSSYEERVVAVLADGVRILTPELGLNTADRV